jgi:DNA helicase HerA-like ATPase
MDEGLAGLAAGYGFDGPAVGLGRAVKGEEVNTGFEVAVPLAMLNRHGLVAGATGTGKTKTIQGLAGRLSDAGVPCFVADMKGDVSGMAEPGEANDKVTARVQQLQAPWDPHPSPVELLTLSGDPAVGVPVRASVSEFGAQLLAKVLELGDVQTSVLNLVFHYADANGLLLADLKDLREVLKFLGTEEGQAAVADLGGVAKPTLGVLLRKLVELEEQGVAGLFGEPAFDVNDLLRTDPSGKGMVTLLELADVADRPRVFSTFMMWLLAELFETLPEVGDTDRPKLVFFFDEAHLLFDGASKAFVDQVQRTVRLIRSKGVGVFFITQLPQDLPDEVLAQLGNRVQHALRAITPKDAAAIDKTVQTYPMTEVYDLASALTSLGVGEAVVTVLSPDGVPTPVAWTRLYPPQSRMAPADPATIQAAVAGSALHDRYAQLVDPDSAYERLTARLQQAEADKQVEADKPISPPKPAPRAPEPARRSPAPKGGVDTHDLIQVGKMALRFMNTPAGREIQRSIFGVLRKRR